MPGISNLYTMPPEMILGEQLNTRVPEADQKRQRIEVEEILRRMRNQPGVILADEVGMGKTFVALAIAYSVAACTSRGPVIVMVPANLVYKWEQDLKTFCELYLKDRHPVQRDNATRKELKNPTSVRYGIARHSIDLMKLLDDPAGERCHLIFLAQGAMARNQSDKWVRLALIGETLRRHGRGRASRLIQVKNQIHRFLAKLLWALGEERAHGWGEELWARLLQTDPQSWKDTYNKDIRDKRHQLQDDPVPKAVSRALQGSGLNLKPLALALEKMPVRARGGDDRLSERLNVARKALRRVEEELWKQLLAQTRWRSPLLVMDEAHHLKNPDTSLARQFQFTISDGNLRTGDGAMAGAFDRMLFLTATPFQLGHHELVRVLERFGDVRWDTNQLGERESFLQQLSVLRERLDESQRSAIVLQRCWSRLRPEDGDADLNQWWTRLLESPRESLSYQQSTVIDAYTAAKRGRIAAQKALRPWIVRYNKGAYWPDTSIARRQRIDGAAIVGQEKLKGLQVPPQQLLPFFLAARSAVNVGKDVLGDALCSSYEAFRFTREHKQAAKDEQDEATETHVDLSSAIWYLETFDRALERCTGSNHPKVDATVRKAVDLWEAGEKVLVFAFYRYTCRALRIHISQEIEHRLLLKAQFQLRQAGAEIDQKEIEQLLERIQHRYFDDADAPGRRAVDAALNEIMREHKNDFVTSQMTNEQCDAIKDIMRRFLRVTTTLARCFPLAELDSILPAEAVRRTLEHMDASSMSWQNKFHSFIKFLTQKCATDERQNYLDAVSRIQTGGIRIESEEDEDRGDTKTVLANVQQATGKTKQDARARLMRAFNTPFFPDILVCSEVMGEGVDLQRFCRHIIHHDLAWNPSTIEQRTGRIDRLGCKAEGRQPIVVYLPYLAGTADERQYRVMSDREQWFRVVMGQDQVAKLITPESSLIIPLPEIISEELSFVLDLSQG
jgi:superfamily II DNA or RNA helicase